MFLPCNDNRGCLMNNSSIFCVANINVCGPSIGVAEIGLSNDKFLFGVWILFYTILRVVYVVMTCHRNGTVGWFRLYLWHLEPINAMPHSQRNIKANWMQMSHYVNAECNWGSTEYNKTQTFWGTLMAVDKRKMNQARQFVINNASKCVCKLFVFS